MVERKLRLAPQVTKISKTPSSKLFVLDTNVLMHDPTSLFRFEEHDIFLPMLTLEELDDNKKGMTEVARNARQASRFLDELVTAAIAISDGIDAGIAAEAAERRRGDRPPVPADRGDHGDAAAVAGRRQGRQPDHRRGHAPAAGAAEAPGHPGVQRHQHAHQGARAGHRGRGLFQRQGARRHRPALHRHARAAGRLLGHARQGHGVVAAGRPHLLPRHGPAVPDLLVNEFVYLEGKGRETPLYAMVQGSQRPAPRCCRR